MHDCKVHYIIHIKTGPNYNLVVMDKNYSCLGHLHKINLPTCESHKSISVFHRSSLGWVQKCRYTPNTIKIVSNNTAQIHITYLEFLHMSTLHTCKHGNKFNDSPQYQYHNNRIHYLFTVFSRLWNNIFKMLTNVLKNHTNF